MASLQPLSEIGQSLDRGSGTPDFILGTDAVSRSKAKGKGRLQDTLRDGTGSNGLSASISPLIGSLITNREDGAAKRPRLGTRLRSFFTSFSATEDGLSGSSSQAKARTSNELQRHNAHDYPLLKPPGLVIPFARQASVQPFGIHGLNDESPPLTPTSEENLSDFSQDRFHWTRGTDGTPSNSFVGSSAQSASGADSPALFSQPRSVHPISLGTGGALSSLLPSHSNNDENATKRARPSSYSTSFSTNSLSTRLEAGLRSRSLRQHIPTLLMLLAFFVFSTLVVVLLLSTLPLKMPSHSLAQLSLSEMREICLSLREYATSSSRAYHHTLLILCIFLTYKQAFNVPGSIVSNIVFGALFGTWRAAFWLSVFTAVGGSGAAIMSAFVAPLVLRMPGMNKAVDMMKHAIGGGRSPSKKGVVGEIPMSRRGSRESTPHRNKRHPSTGRRAHSMSPNPYRRAPASKSSGGNMYSILLLLRVLPLTPYGMMNIACGILNVPLLPFGTTLALGSLPWNAVTAQLGEILVEVVAALPTDSSMDFSATRGKQLDSGKSHNAPVDPTTSAGSAVKAALSSEKAKISSAADKAGGGLKFLMAKIWTREMMFKLIVLSLLSLTPVLVGKWWRARQVASVVAHKKCKTAATSESIFAIDGSGQQTLHQRNGLTAAANVLVDSMPGAQPLTSIGLPSWVNQSSDDDAEGDDEASELGDYDEESGSESGDEDDEAISPTSSTSPLGSFAASVAEKSNLVGPALIASLKRSASRSSWRSAVSRPWFTNPGLASGSKSSLPPDGSSAGWLSRQPYAVLPANEGMTTPQLELAQNPFDAMVHSENYATPARPSSANAWSWTQGPRTQQREQHNSSFSLTHPALDGLHGSEYTYHKAWFSSPSTSTSPAHSRQSSAAHSATSGHERLPPKKLRGVVK